MSDNFFKISKGVNLSPQTADGTNPSNGDIYYSSSLGTIRAYVAGAWANIATGTTPGDVVGPASSTDNAVARYDSTTGKLLQNSVVTISDIGVMAGASIDNSTNSITNINNASIAAGAGIVYSKLANGSALSVLGVAGNSAASNASIAAGTDHFVLRRSGTSLAFGLLTNNNIDASAAIAGTKISPNFGSQNIVTTGTIVTGAGASSLGTVGGISCQLVSSRYPTLGFNAYNSGSYVAGVTGFVSMIQADNTAGGGVIYASASSAVGGAAATLAAIASWTKEGAWVHGPPSGLAASHRTRAATQAVLEIDRTDSNASTLIRFIGNGSNLSYIGATSTDALQLYNGSLTLLASATSAGAFTFGQPNGVLGHRANGALTIRYGTGTATGSSFAEMLRVDANQDVGMTLASPTLNSAYLNHVTPLDASSAGIKFDGSARSVSLYTVNGSTRMTIDNVGGVTFNNIHGATTGNLRSGYTADPTEFGGTNTTSLNVTDVFHVRVGDIVFVTGTYVWVGTANVRVNFSFLLPIASNLGAAGDLNGVLVMDNGGGGAGAIVSGRIYGDPSVDRAKVDLISNTTSGGGSFSFSYRVI